MAEHLIEIFWGLIATGTISIASYCIKQLHKFSKENKAIKDGMLWMQHDRLLQLCKLYLRQKYITIDEMENLEGLYMSYKRLDGNGTIKRLFERVQNLDVQCDDEDE